MGVSFVFDVPGQRLNYCGIGLCDPQLFTNVNGITPYVYQHVHFQWTVDDGEGGTGNISIATGQSVDAFTTSIGDTIPGAWWTQTLQDTNLLTKREGAPVSRGWLFFARGLIVDVSEPFQKSANSSTASRYFAAWLNNADDGAFYQGQIQKALINNTSIEISYSDTGCTSRLGLIKHNPGWVGAMGPQTVGNGKVSVIGFVPFVSVLAFGSEDDARQVSLTLTYGQGTVIQANGSQPPVASPAEDHLVYAPVGLTLVGNICSVADVQSCFPPNGADQKVLQSSGLQAPGLPG